jgi:hypothetical protein
MSTAATLKRDLADAVEDHVLWIGLLLLALRLI